MRRRTFSSWMIGVAVASAIALMGCDDVLAEFQKELLGADKPAYGIALSEEEAYVFETAYAPLTLRVINTGTEPTGVLTVKFIKDSKAFKLSKKTLPSINARKSSKSFTVTVADGLAAGPYEATVLVSGDNGIEATVDVSFTVEDAEAKAAEEAAAEAKAAEERAAAEAKAAAEAEAKAAAEAAEAEAKAAAEAEAKAAAEAAEAEAKAAAEAEAKAAAEAEAKAAAEAAEAEAKAAAEAAEAEAKAAAEAAEAEAKAAAEAAEAEAKAAAEAEAKAAAEAEAKAAAEAEAAAEAAAAAEAEAETGEDTGHGEEVK